MSSLRILSISDDDGLRFSRELLLLSDGYDVESITSNVPLTVAWVRSFDIALLCRSVEVHRAISLTELLRRYNPDIRILCISPLDYAEFYDVDLEVTSGPGPLLDSLRILGNHKPTAFGI